METRREQLDTARQRSGAQLVLLCSMTVFNVGLTFLCSAAYHVAPGATIALGFLPVIVAWTLWAVVLGSWIHGTGPRPNGEELAHQAGTRPGRLR